MTGTHLVYAEDLTPHVWVQGPPRHRPGQATTTPLSAWVSVITVVPEPPVPSTLWVEEVRTYGPIVSVILRDPIDGEQVSLQCYPWQHLNVIDDPDLPALVGFDADELLPTREDPDTP